MLEIALQARLNENVDWTRDAAKSTMAGYAQRQDSADRADRMFIPKGAATEYTIPESDRRQIQSLWADEYPDYLDFHRRFNAWNRRQPSKERLRDISEWKGTSRTPLSEKEKKWQLMAYDTMVTTFIS